MDLSAILGSNGKSNLLGALLPLLLGGKTPDLSSVLGGNGDKENSLLSLLGSMRKESDHGAYPPLFGKQEQGKPSAFSPDALWKIIGATSGNPSVADHKKPQDPYPYELQYNRPFEKKG